MGKEGKFKLGTEQNWIIGTHFPSTNGLISIKTQKRDLPLFLYSLDSMGSQINKAGLKLNVQKTKIIVSSPISSWQTDGETMETVRDFIFGGSKITADGDYSHEIKRRLLLGRKAMHVKKQRHYFANEGPSSQSYGFSSSHVWMWELD